MRRLRFSAALTLLFALPGCPASSEGRALCAAAEVERACGIPAAECLEALTADESFRIDNVFTAWTVSLDGDGTGAGTSRCILRARDLGTTNAAIDIDGGDPEDVTFDVGEARAPGGLLEEVPAA